MFNSPFNFVCVLGGSPAVVTEMLYGFWKLAGGRLKDGQIIERPSSPHFLPENIYLLTTSGNHGGEQHKIILQRQVNNFIKEYSNNSKPPLIEDYLKFIVPKDEQGKKIEDVACEKDEELFDIRCHKIIQELSIEKPNIYISIAGGRKMMAICLSNALQVFGSSLDRAFTVHCNPKIERPGFFFPLPRKKDASHIIQLLNRNYKTCLRDKKTGELVKFDASDVDFDIAEKRILKHGQNIREMVIPPFMNYSDLFDLLELSTTTNNLCIEIGLPTPKDDLKADKKLMELPVAIYSKLNPDKKYPVSLTHYEYMALRMLCRQTIFAHKDSKGELDDSQIVFFHSLKSSGKISTPDKIGLLMSKSSIELTKAEQTKRRSIISRIAWIYCYIREVSTILQNVPKRRRLDPNNYHETNSKGHYTGKKYEEVKEILINDTCKKYLPNWTSIINNNYTLAHEGISSKEKIADNFINLYTDIKEAIGYSKLSHKLWSISDKQNNLDLDKDNAATLEEETAVQIVTGCSAAFGGQSTTTSNLKSKLAQHFPTQLVNTLTPQQNENGIFCLGIEAENIKIMERQNHDKKISQFKGEHPDWW